MQAEPAGSSGNWLAVWGKGTVSVSLGEAAGPASLKCSSHVAFCICFAVGESCWDEDCAACHFRFWQVCTRVRHHILLGI